MERTQLAAQTGPTGMVSGPGEITVLHVDDELLFRKLVKNQLENRSDRTTVVVESDPQSALNRLETASVDCVISDYQMPGMDGLEFLQAVREEYPLLPFIMFTGRGSEEVASEVLDAGATDYLQKSVGTEQYTVLLNRLRNAVERIELKHACQRYGDALNAVCGGVAVLTESGEFIHVDETYADLYGYAPGDLIGEHWERLYRDEDVQAIRETVLPQVTERGRWEGETIGLRADGETFIEDHTIATTENGEFICIVREMRESST